MSCDDLAAVLTLLGLLLELGALIWILWGLGLGDWMFKQRDRARNRWGRIKLWIRRIVPWMRSPKHVTATVNLRGGARASGNGSAELTVARATDLPPPESLVEVGRRLNRIAEDLNKLDRLVQEKSQAVREELTNRINEMGKTQAARHADLEEQVAEETRKRFAERRTEGAVFAGGVALQLAAAVVLLFVC